jgi:hypothetical protein
MTTEQRLAEALEAAHHYPTSPDLWNRVVHSIEEDRRHRRRVITVVTVVLATLAAAVLIGLAGVGTAATSGVPTGNRIDWRLLEALEFGVIAIVVAALGPAIRRFGRGYVVDIFHTSPDTAARLLRLLDVAYALLFGGYALITTRLGPPVSYTLTRLGDQVEEASMRLGGLLLLMGVLHAVTLIALPLIGLVFNANRRRAKLPKWITMVLVVAAAWLAVQSALAIPLLLGR